MAIVALVLPSAVLSMADPGHGIYRKAFFILPGLLFPYVRLMPRGLWMPGPRQ
jgi:hypothetical protein